jgi:Tat protein secretion system quality control protein TatD with DNase activity
LSHVDAHLHLAHPTYSDKIELIMDNAINNKVTRLLSNAMDYDTSIETVSLAKQYGFLVLAAVGVHPWTIVSGRSFDPNRFEPLLDENRKQVRAIMEIGLNLKCTQDKEKRDGQKEVFQFFLEVAEKRWPLIVVHSRLAVDEV